MKNPSWEITDVKLEKNSKKYDCCEDIYDDVTATFTLRRRETHGRIAAAVISSWLILVVFLISPSKAGERIVFAGFVFVALVVLTSSLNATVPEYSNTRLGRYQLAGLLITAIITAINSVIHRIYPANEDGKVSSLKERLDGPRRMGPFLFGAQPSSCFGPNTCISSLYVFGDAFLLHMGGGGGGVGGEQLC